MSSNVRSKLLEVLQSHGKRPCTALDLVRALKGQQDVSKSVVNRELYALERSGTVQRLDDSLPPRWLFNSDKSPPNSHAVISPQHHEIRKPASASAAPAPAAPAAACGGESSLPSGSGDAAVRGGKDVEEVSGSGAGGDAGVRGVLYCLDLDNQSHVVPALSSYLRTASGDAWSGTPSSAVSPPLSGLSLPAPATLSLSLPDFHRAQHALHTLQRHVVGFHGPAYNGPPAPSGSVLADSPVRDAADFAVAMALTRWAVRGELDALDRVVIVSGDHALHSLPALAVQLGIGGPMWQTRHRIDAETIVRGL